MQRWRHGLHLGEQKELQEGNISEAATTGYHQRLAPIMTDIPGNLGTQHNPVLWTRCSSGRWSHLSRVSKQKDQVQSASSYNLQFTVHSGCLQPCVHVCERAST